MKRICFFIGSMNRPGGTERVTAIIANELAKKGYEVSILSSFEGDNPFFELHPTIMIDEVYKYKVSMKKNGVSLIRKIRKFVIKQKIDTLIVVDSLACVFTIPAMIGLNVKHICWEHFNFNYNLGVKLRDIGRILAARYCDGVVTLTEEDKQLWINGLSKISAKLISIANPTPYENIETFPKLESKVILAMGRLTSQKGFDMLLQAWALVSKSHNEWILHIVGSGEEEPNLKSMAVDLNIIERVTFIPFTKDVEKYYQEASFYCLSSRFEGFGMVILEAMSFGLPVISFDCECGPTELINKNINGFLTKSNDITALGQKLIEIMNMSNEKYIKLSQSAKMSSKKYYVSNLIDKWIEVI